MNTKQVSNSARRGVASIVLVIVLVVAGFAVVGMVLGGARDQDLSVARVNSLQAFYAAEAGVNLAVREVIDNTDYDGDGEIGSIQSTAATESALHGAVLAVSKNVSGSDITLTSLGVDQNARHSFSTGFEVTTSSGSGPAIVGVSVNADIDLSGSSRIDALDSSSSTYSPWSDSSDYAHVQTNSTGSNTVDLNGSSRIHGDVYVGTGGNPVDVIDFSGSSTITGTQDVLSEALSLPSITTPSGLPASAGDYVSASNGSSTISAGTYHYDGFKTRGSHSVSISGDVVIYCDGLFEMTGSTSITLNTGATLVVYADNFDFSGSTTMNMPGAPNPSLVTLLQYGTTAFETKGSSKVAATVIAPNAKVDMAGSTRIFGAVAADRIELAGSSRFTQDLALAGYVGGGGGGGGSGSSTIVLSTWSQVSPQ